MYCSKCGKEIVPNAAFCISCGSAVKNDSYQTAKSDFNTNKTLLITLSQRLNTNGIIWLVIGIIQILGGIFINWVLLIVGVLNIVSSIQDMQYSKTLLEKPNGIVAKFEPITGPVITLVYNLVIGGIIGVVGSVYYFLGIRNYVMENKQFFVSLDVENN